MTINVVFPLDDPSNYAVAGVEISGGAARLVQQVEANETFRCRFQVDADFDATLADGSPVGTPVGGPVVTGGKLELLGAAAPKYVQFAGAGNFDANPQQGAVRFKVTPNYSGGHPNRTQFFFNISHSHLDARNNLAIHHDAGSGNLRMSMFDQSGVSNSVILGAWSPVAGTEYEFEWNYDFDTGEQRLFIDGVQFGATQTKVFTRSSTIGIMRLGHATTSDSASFSADFTLDDFQHFTAVQHTANYTPGPSPVEYSTGTLETNAAFQAEAVTGFGSTETPNGGTVLFALRIDGQLRWFDGLAWADSDGSAAEMNTAADINANAATAISGGAALVRIFSRLTAPPAGDVTPELDEFVFCYDFGPIAPADSPLCEVYGFVRDLAGQPVAGAVVTADPIRNREFVENGETVILGPVSATTDADGRWDLKLVQGLEARITIASGSEPVVDAVEFGAPIEIVVPALDWANIVELLPAV